MLRALPDTSLTTLYVVFLFLGQTHNKLDRLLSCISVAPRAKDYFTVEGVVAASPGDIAVHVVALEPLGPSVAMQGIDRGRHVWRGASDAQPCPGTCFPVFDGRLRDLYAVEAVEDRRGMVQASTGIVRAGGRACGALAPCRGLWNFRPVGSRC